MSRPRGHTFGGYARGVQLARLLALMLSAIGGAACAAAADSNADATAPTTIHVVRVRTSFEHTASKFTYVGNYTCFFSKYWGELSEPEPTRTEHAKQRALASAPPLNTYSDTDVGEVEEYFAPGRYARYERSTVFVPAGRGTCTLERVLKSTVQIAQGTRLVNAVTKNGITTVSGRPLLSTGTPLTQATKQAGTVLEQVAPTWGGGFSPGTVTQVGEKKVLGKNCDLMSSSQSIFATVTDLCVWRDHKTYLTPAGAKAVVLFSETRASVNSKPGTVTDPIVLNTIEILHWTEQATELRTNEEFADGVFTPPNATQ